MRRPRACPQRVTDVVFAAYLATVAVVRWRTLAALKAPPTIDAGNWLAFGHSLLGRSVRSTSIVYPPVVPLLTVAATETAGAFRGVVTLAAVASLAPAAGMYLVLRGTGLGWAAALLSGMLAVGTATGEAAAWGGFPQLLSLGLYPVLLASLDGFLRSATSRAALRTGVVLAVLLATSHFIALVAATSAGVLIALHLQFHRTDERQPSVRHLARRAPVVLLPSVWLAPLYLTVTRSLLTGPEDASDDVPPANGDIIEQVEFVYRDFAVFWRIAFVVAALAPFVFLDRRRSRLWLLTTSGALGVVAAMPIIHDARLAYFLPSITIFGLALCVWDLNLLTAAVRGTPQPNSRPVHPTLLELLDGATPEQRAQPNPRRVHRTLRVVSVGTTAVLVLSLGVQTQRGMNAFPGQRDFYGILTPELTDAISWLRENTPGDALVAVTSVGDAPLGWWVEGLGERSTVFASRLRWLNFSDERRRARIGNDIFDPPFPSDEAFDVARQHGVDYLLVVGRWGGYDDGRVRAYLTTKPSVVAFENGDTLVLTVPPSGGGGWSPRRRPSRRRSAATCLGRWGRTPPRTPVRA